VNAHRQTINRPIVNTPAAVTAGKPIDTVDRGHRQAMVGEGPYLPDVVPRQVVNRCCFQHVVAFPLQEEHLDVIGEAET
jgi:hypothetical protein